MTRMEFMVKLGALLKELPDGERLEALRYYNEYFADAGEENEQQVIEELGSPEKIAQEIYGKERWETLQKKKAQKEQAEFVFKNGSYGDDFGKEETIGKKKMGLGWKLLLLVLLCPIWIPVLAVVFGVAFGVLMAILGMVIAVLAVGVSGLAAGAVVLVFGILRLLAIPSVGVLLMGVGAILLGIGILAILLLPLCWKLVCRLIRTIVELLRKIFVRSRANG